MSSERAVLRIGEVSRRTGVAVPTLRAWERRYGLLEPERTEGGHRLYREDDVHRVRAMSRLMTAGWSAAAAATEVADGAAPLEPTPARPHDGDAADQLVERLQRAIEAFDAAAANAVLDDVLARMDVPRALDEVVLPVLRDVGEGWREDPRVISREHFATNVLRPRLQRLLQVPVPQGARSCIAAAPEAEEHDLGLLAAGVVAAHAGWRVHFLGARMPTAALERSVAELRPQVVLIAALHREHAVRFLDDSPRLGSAAVVLGGTGFHAEDVQRLPGALIHQEPIGATATVLERAVRSDEDDAINAGSAG